MRNYDKESSKVILLAKEGSNKKAIQLISLSLFTLIQSLTYELNLYNPINIVTIPSSGRSIMKRGRNYIDEVCIEVIKLLRSSSIHAFNTPVLNHVRKVKDQSNLNKIQRFNNLENAYSLKDQSLVGGTCILMDDLITTGSSISEAIRALSEAKITILGGCDGVCSRAEFSNTISHLAFNRITSRGSGGFCGFIRQTLTCR